MIYGWNIFEMHFKLGLFLYICVCVSAKFKLQSGVSTFCKQYTELPKLVDYIFSVIKITLSETRP